MRLGIQNPCVLMLDTALRWMLFQVEPPVSVGQVVQPASELQQLCDL